ncbi:excinuclease UvrABC ATPase subunit [Thermocatellispora tengchongensis]|uniref:UvrABC system protein A n=1 Tax=Thermocatellispora tengchongensis TaxID=1073253 RepID=A0A840PHE0_9ACTN|nr:excinuclease ABC subunit UvrA [Thermocatellispora tengchongensis]MBB5138552.1 excinuclease UvrABC ATPase subunit [Thermocatellispora tengchongensis]
MSQDPIRVAGARENNLKHVSVEIPRRELTVFTGVSGSGKSSLVFDTIAAEAQRQLNETFTAFQRTFLPKYGQPAVDSIENLSAAIVVDQKRIGGNSRSTVGTVTDIYALLRLLFSRIGTPHAGESSRFSFNDPAGMCPECEGIGKVITLDLDRFLDRSKSLNEGALLHPQFAVGGWFWGIYANSGLFDNDKKLSDYTEDEWELLLHGSGVKVPLSWQGGQVNSSYEGVVTKFTRLYIKKDTGEMSERNREVFQRFVTSAVCPLCRGARLNQAVLECRIGGRNIAEMAAMEAGDLVGVLAAIDDPVARPIVAGLVERLGNLVAIGLGYLSLDRETATLSGGESQRIKMVRHLGSALIDMLYIFDEPSVGLHPRDVRMLNDLLRKLRDKGNTVLVVEHDRDVIEIADHVVDMGPGAGAHGGEVVYQGPVTGLAESGTLTGTHLRHRLPVKTEVREPTGKMMISDATLHNLRGVTVGIPTGVLTVVTGVAGSGKSTLINEVFLRQHPGAIAIDQSAVGASIRSTPATYTGLMDPVRKLFATANGVSPALFSFNSKGACPECQGLGIVYTDLAFMEGLRSRCEACGGRRFREEVLGHTLRGRSISDVLDMTAAEALEFFAGERKLRPVLQALNDVGLDYLTLGQPLSTLSGGECQRIKLATELHKTGTVYVMDEPTTGLHMSDVGNLLRIIDGLVERGNSVIVIEHDLDVIKNADWIIDLGPEGGAKGGRVLFEGPPARLLTATGSHTAEYVRADVG